MYSSQQGRLWELVTMEESLGRLHASMGMKTVRAQAWEGQGCLLTYFSIIKKKISGMLNGLIFRRKEKSNNIKMTRASKQPIQNIMQTPLMINELWMPPTLWASNFSLVELSS